jgi:hypothetical protein
LSLRFSLMSWSIIACRDSTSSGPPCRLRRPVAVLRVVARARVVVLRGRRVGVLTSVRGSLLTSSDIITLRCRVWRLAGAFAEYNVVFRPRQKRPVGAGFSILHVQARARDWPCDLRIEQFGDRGGSVRAPRGRQRESCHLTASCCAQRARSRCEPRHGSVASATQPDRGPQRRHAPRAAPNHRHGRIRRTRCRRPGP